MTAHRHRRRGMTLVEVVVVMAIIGIVSGIAVAAFRRGGAFGRTEGNDVAREVYTMLRAARAYAASKNVDTAVVYMIQQGENGCRFIDGMGLFYKVEARGDDPDLYAVVEGRPETFTLFQEGYGIPGGDIYTNPCLPLELDEKGLVKHTELVRDSGFSRIWIQEVLERELYGLERPGYRETGPDRRDFPAHVFRASGRLDASTQKERIVLRIEPTPDFADEEFMTTSRIEIYKSTGRVRIGDGE